MWRHESVPCTCAQRVGESFGRKGGVTQTQSLQGTCILVWHMCHVNFDPARSKLTPQGSILFFSLMPSSSDTLWRNFTKFGTRVQCNKGFQNMYKLGGWKNRGVRISNFQKNAILNIFGRIMKKERKIQKLKKKIQKSKIWTPNFWTPQIMNIRIALAHVHPCTKFGVPRFKSVRARGQKADKIKMLPGGTILTLGADSPIDTQFRPRRFWPESLGSRPLPVWAATLTQHFSKGSRGGTWHVPGGTQRHVTAAIVVPPFRRIEWAVSRPDRPSRSGAIHWASVVH